MLADEVFRFLPAEVESGAAYLPFVEALPERTSRKAWAPNETRRANGDAGVFMGAIFSLSPSSVTASSKLGDPDPTELERLFWRAARLANGEV